MFRIGVIGGGRHSSSNHGPALKTYKTAHPEKIHLAAVCDKDAERARIYAQNFGFARTYHDYTVMLEKEKLDGIVAVTPIVLTRTVVADLLTKGIPLLFEKTPGKSSVDTKELLRIARENNTLHMISFNRRFNPAVVKAREWLREEGMRRAPKLMIARMLRHARKEENFIVGTGIHAIDTVLSFLGPPETITRSIIRFANGSIAHIIIAPEVGVTEETYEIVGQDYCVQIDTIKCSIRIFDQGQKSLTWEAPEDSAPCFTGGTLGETEVFIQCITEGKGYSPDLEEGLLSMLTAEAIQNG